MQRPVPQSRPGLSSDALNAARVGPASAGLHSLRATRVELGGWCWRELSDTARLSAASSVAVRLASHGLSCPIQRNRRPPPFAGNR